jgi:hypothetical protein
LGIANHDDITVDGSGNVGIGTSTVPTRLTSYSTSSDYQLELGFDSTFSWKLGRVASTGSLQFTGYNGGATPVVPMTFDLDGNVGIGTSSPSSKLDINGSVTATSYAGDGSALTGITGGGPSLGTNSIIRTNAQTISENITIPADTNGMSIGNITVADTFTVTVNGRWVII